MLAYCFNFFFTPIKLIQWNLDLTKYQQTGKTGSLNRGSLYRGSLFVYFTVT